jgi:beta-N-acetylhexosaminidase
VGVGTPYDVVYVPPPTFISTYSFNPPALNAMLAVAFGEAAPQGKLPVTIRSPSTGQKLYPFGYGLQL